jgi:hypothetical protein
MPATTIRPRKPAFSFGDVPRHWMKQSPLATAVANGVNLLFPAGERFFVRSVNHYAKHIDDPELAAQVRGFFGQEGRHANAHEQYMQALREQGFEIDRFLRLYERIAYGVQEKLMPPLLNLAGTAAAEHFTAIMAANALEEDVFAEVHPAMRELLMWHAAEEIEHKAVAFDVLRRVNPSYAVRMTGLAVATLNFFGWWLAGTLMLLRQEGLGPLALRAEARRLRRERGDSGAPTALAVLRQGIREYVRRDFHPNDVDDAALARAYLERAGLEPAGQEAAA